MPCIHPLRDTQWQAQGHIRVESAHLPLACACTPHSPLPGLEPLRPLTLQHQTLHRLGLLEST